MTLIMTMTPLHMADHGHGLTAVGTVISGHVFGMFALAPLSGRLSDRFGALPTIFAGMGLLSRKWGEALRHNNDGHAFLPE